MNLTAEEIVDRFVGVDVRDPFVQGALHGLRTWHRNGNGLTDGQRRALDHLRGLELDRSEWRQPAAGDRFENPTKTTKVRLADRREKRELTAAEGAFLAMLDPDPDKLTPGEAEHLAFLGAVVEGDGRDLVDLVLKPVREHWERLERRHRIEAELARLQPGRGKREPKPPKGAGQPEPVVAAVAALLAEEVRDDQGRPVLTEREAKDRARELVADRAERAQAARAERIADLEAQLAELDGEGGG